MKNVDQNTVRSFGSEWSKLDQAALSDSEREYMFNLFFSIFPWGRVPNHAEGFDMGCGSGRWAMLVAPRVGLLNCIDASDEALSVARRNLQSLSNVQFIHASVDSGALEDSSQDFGYSLGVLHHVPDTFGALQSCVRSLKDGAPFLVYIYYSFDNRPIWYRSVWKTSEIIRSIVSRLPDNLKTPITNIFAATVYFPLAKISLFGERAGLNMRNFPLYGYRNNSFYTMRTDSRDRFGTPLEKRFSKDEIRDMMERAGLVDIVFSDHEPYWSAVGLKASTDR